MRETGTAPASDFPGVSQGVLVDLRIRVGMDAWCLSRRDGSEEVILSAVDEIFGLHAGTVLPWADSFCVPVIDAHASMIAGCIDEEPAYAQARSQSGIAAASCLSVPVSAPDGEVLGCLYALGTHERRDLQKHLPTVLLQASLLGTLLAHELHLAQELRIFEQSDAEEQRDRLTGAFNRRAWNAALRAEEGRARRYATSAALVVINLTSLKGINQESGHGGGDDVLVRTAAMFKRRLRGIDVLAHLGNGDFAIILPETSAKGAHSLVEDLRALLDQAGTAAAIGFARRRSDTGMAGAWKAADVAMHADKLQASQRLIEYRKLVPPGPGALAMTETNPPIGLSSVDALLQLAKDQLGMDVAFLNTFEGTRRRFRNLVSSVDLPISAGSTEPSAGSYCQLIADGALDELIPDAAADPRVRDLPVTARLGIASYVGVPVHRRDGTLYGTLCTFSQQADTSLRERDTSVLRAIAGVVMDLVEHEDRGHHQRHALLQRLDALYAMQGPTIVYQPIQTLDRLETIGVEALSRFPNESPSPDHWFQAAAKAGVGSRLELAALQNAVGVLAHMQGFLALNVSPETLFSPGFDRFISDLPLHRIVLEITEHEPIDDYEPLRDVLEPLRRGGLRIAIDDAGAGFASMRHILALVPNFIKLDISLVRGIDSDGPRQALAAALATFSFKTGALVIAEGIETAGELECLRTLNIDLGQGYHLARPAAIADLEI